MRKQTLVLGLVLGTALVAEADSGEKPAEPAATVESPAPTPVAGPAKPGKPISLPPPSRKVKADAPARFPADI
jgi:hypothetical protein